MTTIIHTRPGKEHFDLFQELPQRLYSKEEQLFMSAKNLNEDLLKDCYVLLLDGEPVARAALYINPHLKFQDKTSCCIGNYESIDNVEIGSALLRYVISSAKIHGSEFIVGPMNGSTWDNYRFSDHHDQPLFFTESYHHLYYNQHFMAAGFGVIAHYYSNIAGPTLPTDSEIHKKDQELLANGVKIRPIDLENYDFEMGRIHQFNTFAFSHNFLYTPISQEAFIKKYAGMATVLNPDYTLMAEDADGNLIGYYFCVNDKFNGSEKSLIFKTLVRHPDSKWRGLGHVMGHQIYQKAISEGYKSFIHPFIYENGTSINLSRNFSGERFKTYVLYGKEI